ncbi:hypothetical protein [Streptomyces lydicus]|uniref:hypothetical protein n=1 Tax=Streptomyces lydicus TaxID=47763 RepID=UPI0036E83BB4
MAAVDTLINATLDAVRKSGMLEAGALMATVSAVNSDGTATVTRGTDTYPKVRLLTGYNVPTVGDRVEILKTSGGWVCVGALVAATPTPQWVSITPGTGFTNNGNSNGTLQYRILNLHGSTHVEWCGGVSWATSGSPPNSGLVCTVPVNARPLSNRSLSAAAGSDVVKVDFRTDGTVTIVQRNPSTLSTWCSLNGLMYRID